MGSTIFIKKKKMKKLIILLFIPFISFTQYQNIDYDKRISSIYWMVNGVQRNALVYIPKKELLINVPLIFVWHGHGGSAEKFIKRFPVHKLWKEAIVVFPQGVNSKSPWDIKAEKTGWQFQIGDYKDRDIKFFDTMYTYFSNAFPIDDERVYCTGSSNGGTFTYILLQLRPKVFAAAAPAITANIGLENIHEMSLPPIPIFHTSGKKENSFTKQKKLVNYIIKDRKAEYVGYWNDNILAEYYKSDNGNLVWFKHNDGHRWRTKDTALIVDFFKKINNKISSK